jgi:hypothetical protein
MGWIELIAGAFYLMILIMRYTTIPFNESLLWYSSLVFATYYLLGGIGMRKGTFFLLSLFRHDGEDKLLVIFRLFSGVSFAAVFGCIWMHEVYHPLREHGSLVVSIFLGLVLFFGLYFFDGKVSSFSSSLMVRGVPLSLGILFYMIFSVESRIKWRYDDNYYRELLLTAVQNPYSEEAQTAAQRYYEQMQGIRPEPSYYQGVDDTQK